MEMAIFAKDRIEVRNSRRDKATLTDPTEPIYEVKINGETDAQKTSGYVNKER